MKSYCVTSEVLVIEEFHLTGSYDYNLTWHVWLLVLIYSMYMFLVKQLDYYLPYLSFFSPVDHKYYYQINITDMFFTNPL